MNNRGVVMYIIAAIVILVLVAAILGLSLIWSSKITEALGSKWFLWVAIFVILLTFHKFFEQVFKVVFSFVRGILKI